MAKKKIEVPKKDVTQTVKMGNENNKVNVSEPKLANKNVPNPTSYPETRELFAHKKDYGVTAMTQQASMRADETAKDRRANGEYNIPPRLGKCIHKIRED